jgi:tetratricopeptide (TPR) repeat protein
MREYAPGISSSELSLIDTQTNSSKEKAAPDAAPPSSAAEATSEPSEDRYLVRAREEHAKGHVDSALWVRALAQVGGDRVKALPVYLDTRATAIRVAKRQEKAARKARVVEALSQPDDGLELPTPVVAETRTSKSARNGARPNRKVIFLAAGVLVSTLAIVAVVALWPATAPAPAPSAAKAAPTATVSARITTAAQANAAKTESKAADGTTEATLSRVQALEKEGNWNLLVIYTAEWTRKQPFNPQAWKTLSVGYAKLRQFTEALDAATKATELAPDDWALWQNLGQINLAVPRPAEALAAFQRATALNEKDLVSLAQVGTLNTQLGHLAEAKLAFDKALALNPEDIPTLCGSATLAQKEGRTKDTEAIALHVTALDARCPSPSEGQTVRVASAPPLKKPAVSPARRSP